MSLFLLYLYYPIKLIKKLSYSEIVEFVFDIQKAFIMDISVQNMAKCKDGTNVCIHSVWPFCYLDPFRM